MDPDSKRNGENALGGLDKQAHGLERMAHDKFRFGVAFGLLVQEFDGGHFFTLLGNFDAVGNENETSICFDRGREQMQGNARPQSGQKIEFDSGRMKLF